MTDWNRGNDLRNGTPPDPWQELPAYTYEPPQGPEQGPDLPVVQVPIERLGEWHRQARAMVSADLKEYARVQAIVGGLSLLSLGLLAGPMMAGYYRYMLRRLHGGPAPVNDLFSGFTDSLKATFVPGLALTWGTGAAVAILAVVANLLLGQIPYLGVLFQALALLAGTVAIMAVSGFLTLMFPLMHQRQLGSGEAWQTCVEMLKRDWARAGVFGLAIGGPFMVGLVLLVVGALAGGPFGLLMGAQGYRAMFEPESA